MPDNPGEGLDVATLDQLRRRNSPTRSRRRISRPRRKPLPAVEPISVAYPALPVTAVSLDEPFQIWSTRFGDEHTRQVDIIKLTHRAPGHSFAKIDALINDPEEYLIHDQLSFYFEWRNRGENDAIIDATTRLTLHGKCFANAYDGWIWTPFPGVQSIGESTVTLFGELAPWTRHGLDVPVEVSPSGFTDIARVAVTGQWTPIAGPAIATDKEVVGTFSVNANQISVPAGDSAILQVIFNAQYEIDHGGQAGIDFDKNDDDRVACPGVVLDVVYLPKIGQGGTDPGRIPH
jgi:hypothetical protein